MGIYMYIYIYILQALAGHRTPFQGIHSMHNIHTRAPFKAT
jgi:hypothetical protein